MSGPFVIAAETVIAETRAWVERAVIGLNLCPFAKAVWSRNQIRYVVSDATGADDLLGRLREELDLLAGADSAQVETTLLIHPCVLTNFVDFNDFLGVADAMLETLGYAGVLQVASFHPQYRFRGTTADDVANATNRSPYPTLHLLREESVDRAVAASPDAADDLRTQHSHAAGARAAGLGGAGGAVQDGCGGCEQSGSTKLT